jgi:ATP-dependent helicase/DNAse subunit B
VPRPETLATWQARAAHLLAEVAEEMGLGPHDATRRAGLERMRTLLAGFLARESTRNWSVRPDPKLLEAKFGDDAEVGALDLGEFEMRGSIDRVDVAVDPDGRRVGLVRDYKLSSGVTAPAKFDDEGKLQLQLYMLALRDRFGVEPIGGLYEPLASDGTKKPRGPLLSDAREELLDAKSTSKTDALGREEFEATLQAAHAKATDVVDRMRAGRVTRNPLGGVCPRWCSFQPICRRERAPLADREDTKKENGDDEG